MTTREKLDKVFSSGSNFIFQNEVKKKDGEWELRITWTHVRLPGNIPLNTCTWFGFENIDDCLDDCLLYLEIIENKKK